MAVVPCLVHCVRNGKVSKEVQHKQVGFQKKRDFKKGGERKGSEEGALGRSRVAGGA